MQTTTILGDGAMATVCAQVLAADDKTAVTMWGRDAARLAEMSATHQNQRYLPGIPLNPKIAFEPDDAKAFRNADLIICAVPTQFIRPSLIRLAQHFPVNAPIVSVAKGIEIQSLKRPSEVILELAGDRRPVAAFSGPNIAAELIRKLPATAVIAAQPDQEPLALKLQELFTTPYLRVYRNDDLLGVELAGALKNVIAVAAGILDGMKAGNNAKAALLTRGLVEITRLATLLGAKPETFMGLAGLSDLITTCVSPEGRNRTFGERIGKGESANAVLNSIAGVVEGVPTTKSVIALARARKVEMPIAQGLHAVLFEGRNPKEQLADLMARESKQENP
jgi:glycerol-3-phosphate dehydrogenase (NAD(P)+)